MEAVQEKAKLERYPAYKDSGVDWLGEIPESWNSLPIRAIFEERIEKNEGPKTDFILSVTKDRGVIPYDEKGQIGNNKSEDIERYKIVYPKDFVINKMNVIIGSLGLSKYYGAFSQVYLVYKPKTTNINIEYYSYLFSNPSFYKSLIRYCTGIMELRESLNKIEFKKLVLPFPDYKTQSAIATFLDEKCGRIDQAIAQKQHLIKLLKEREEIIIHNALVKGLNPSVDMIDSGEKLIGQIPKHWNFSKLSNFIDILSGYPFPSSGFQNEGIKLLRGINISVNRIRWGDVVFWPQNKIEQVKTFLLEEDDVVLGMDRPLISGGMRIASVKKEDQPCLLLQRTARIRAKNGLNQEYLIAILKSKIFMDYFTPILSGVSVPHISPKQIQSFRLGIPDRNEQQKILSYIKKEQTQISRVVELQQQQIKKLKEYKSSLIDSAVTGKINVGE